MSPRHFGKAEPKAGPLVAARSLPDAAGSEQFQEKRETVFRPELRQNRKLRTNKE
jgi:hypothetical protein